MIGEEKGSVAISGRSSHKMTGLISAQKKKTEQHLQGHKLNVIFCALMKHQALLTIQAKLKVEMKLIITFFYFSVVIQSGEFLASVWQEEENFEVLKRCYIQIYPTRAFLLC